MSQSAQPSLSLVTWNLNSVRARLDRLLAWLERARPGVVGLQELKVTDDAFPHEAIRALGYDVVTYGQPTYNGVAILSRLGAPEEVERGFGDGEDDDEQARFIVARVAGVRVACAYFPNGGELDSSKYVYKLRWIDRLHAWLDRRADPAEPLALLGDYNIAVDDLDARKPEVWRGGVLLNDTLSEHMARLARWGFTDALRREHPEGGVYTWWDYRNLCFPRNDGLRIDHVLLTAPLAARLRRAWVDRDERKGKKPSDHAPVWVELE